MPRPHARPLIDVMTGRLLAPPGRIGGDRERPWWRCPFHDDPNPSLTILPGRTRWYCFGCKATGDAIDLIQRLDPSIGFAEARAEAEGAAPGRTPPGSARQAPPPQAIRPRAGRPAAWDEFARRVAEEARERLWVGRGLRRPVLPARARIGRRVDPRGPPRISGAGHLHARGRLGSLDLSRLGDHHPLGVGRLDLRPQRPPPRGRGPEVSPPEGLPADALPGPSLDRPGPSLDRRRGGIRRPVARPGTPRPGIRRDPRVGLGSGIGPVDPARDGLPRSPG